MLMANQTVVGIQIKGATSLLASGDTSMPYSIGLYEVHRSTGRKPQSVQIVFQSHHLMVHMAFALLHCGLSSFKLLVTLRLSGLAGSFKGGAEVSTALLCGVPFFR